MEMLKSYRTSVVVSGLWYKCDMVCQKWCCVCWSWWITESAATCCCIGDTQLGSVNYTSTFVY